MLKGEAISAEFENQFYDLYRQFFRRAEDDRRWNVEKDVPWDQLQCPGDRSNRVNRGDPSMAVGAVSAGLHLQNFAPWSARVAGRAWFSGELGL